MVVRGTGVASIRTATSGPQSTGPTNQKGNTTMMCPECHGDGVVIQFRYGSSREFEDNDNWTERRCPTCGGSGDLDLSH